MFNLTDFYGCDLFEGFDKLTVSEMELVKLRSLKELAAEHQCEYGIAHNANGFCSPFTSGLEDKVRIPDEVYVGNEIRLYHCHTNNTCLSRDDLSLLINPTVQRITVITPLGVVFSARRGNGVLPTLDEFNMYAEEIAAEVNIELTERDGFYEWSLERRFHEAVKEEAFIITRYFGWIIEGGML